MEENSYFVTLIFILLSTLLYFVKKKCVELFILYVGLYNDIKNIQSNRKVINNNKKAIFY